MDKAQCLIVKYLSKFDFMIFSKGFYQINCAHLLILAILCHAASVEATAPDFNSREMAWLKKNDRQIRIAHTPDWPPMDFLGEEGKPSGMVREYILLIEKKLGIRFSVVPVRSWGEVLDLAKSGDIDLISAAQPTEERRKFMNWSTPFLKLKTTIIVQQKIKGKLSLDGMKGMKIGVVAQYAVGEFIKDIYPELTLMDVPDSRDGIRKVSFGELDAMITELPNALFLIDQEKITNLRLAGDTGFELKHGMGIRKDWPLFLGIIEKTIASITDAEHRSIYQHWVTLETPKFYQNRAFWYWMMGIASSTLVVIVIVLIWNRELKKQVHQRTEALRFNEIGLEALLALNEHPHNSIPEVITFSFRQMLDLTQSRFGYLTLKDPDGMTYVLESVENGGKEHFKTVDRESGFTRDTIGLWGEAVKQGRPVISNDYAVSNPERFGVPRACHQISRYMNVPIYSGDDVVVVAGMGNKRTDYTQADLRQLTLLAQGMWRLIQRKKAEQAKDRMAHLLTIQDKMASLGHVSAGIAHEIRNPLSGINIYLGTIEKYYQDPEKRKKIDDAVQSIRTASKKIESVIRRVMNFAKPSEPRFALINLNDPVNEAINLSQVTLRKQGIQLKTALGQLLPPCYAEPHLIEEVILNLINNAADALSNHTEKPIITISSQIKGDQIQVTVEDNGTGIPEKIREKIFDPFFTTKSHSTGIGLSLCHRIITDHKGKITSSGSSIGGATFTISIPCTKTQEPEQTPSKTHRL